MEKIEQNALVIYGDDANYKDFMVTEEEIGGLENTKEGAHAMGTIILREWLHATKFEDDISDEDRDDPRFDLYIGTFVEEWGITSVFGDETQGVWVATANPYRGEDVTFMFHL